MAAIVSEECDVTVIYSIVMASTWSGNKVNTGQSIVMCCYVAGVKAKLRVSAVNR